MAAKVTRVHGESRVGRRMGTAAPRPAAFVFDARSSHASSSNSENLRLTALIEGRHGKTRSKAPSSLLEVFINPCRFREQSLLGLLVEVVGALGFTEISKEFDAKELAKRVIESHLKEAPLSKEGLSKLAATVESFGLPAYLESMQKQSIVHGTKLLGELGYEFEANGLSRPRGFLLEVISLAQVGRRLSDWLKEGREAKEAEKNAATIGIAELKKKIGARSSRSRRRGMPRA